MCLAFHNCLVPHFPPLQVGADNSSPAFSSLAFSAPPLTTVNSEPVRVAISLFDTRSSIICRGYGVARCGRATHRFRRTIATRGLRNAQEVVIAAVAGANCEFRRVWLHASPEYYLELNDEPLHEHRLIETVELTFYFRSHYNNIDSSVNQMKSCR